ncbi:MAG: hypothetical protein IKU38_06030 [Clostridia bacterium]|nr:hypothetical protein [Clostridia bacterium]
MCPVCKKHELLYFDICDECGWENDPLQHDQPDYSGGANKISLNEARTAYSKKQN